LSFGRNERVVRATDHQQLNVVDVWLKSLQMW
jgi:hypothetical protein